MKIAIIFLLITGLELILVSSNAQSMPAEKILIVYLSRTNNTILFGGHDGENVFGDLWTFKDKKWTLIEEKKPLKRIDNGH